MPRKISEQVTATGVVTDFSTPVYLPAAQGGAPVAVAIDENMALAILAFLATSPAVVIWADMKAGTADDRFITPKDITRFKKPETKDYAATVTLDFGATDDDDLDDGFARSIRQVVQCTGDCTINLDNIDGDGLEGETITITLYNADGGSKAFDIATANGITVSLGDNVSHPGAAATATIGQGLRMHVEIMSATAAVVRAYEIV